MKHPFVLEEGEQLNLTPEQAEQLMTLDLIYRPEPENEDYFTTVPEVTLDDVEAALTPAREES